MRNLIQSFKEENHYFHWLDNHLRKNYAAKNQYLK